MVAHGFQVHLSQPETILSLHHQLTNLYVLFKNNVKLYPKGYNWLDYYYIIPDKV